MDIFTEIQDRLETKKFQKINKSFNGGCISKGASFDCDNGKIFVKMNSDSDALEMFNGELFSLQKIQETKTIRVPKPYFCIADPNSNGGALVVEYLEINSVSDWKKLGSNLADLHLFNSVLGKKKRKLEGWIGKPPKSELPQEIDLSIRKDIKLEIPDEIVEKIDYVEQFGFDTTTCCGKLPLNNEWHNNWIEFYARNRLAHQINMAIENYSDRRLIEYWSELQLKIDKFFIQLTKPIEPSLLHGDLWSGNIGQVESDPIIFDPASFYGHSEFELSIAKLFGGFRNQFYEVYFEKLPQEKGFTRRRELYTLFHLLNHWNHFGEPYGSQSIQSIQRLSKYKF